MVVAVAMTVLQITGCGSTANNSGIYPGASAMTAISEQRVAASEFRRQGVKVFYTLTGGLEAIEVTGYAPVWGNSANAVRESYRAAELEAKKSLNDFINNTIITSTVSVRMISQNLEQARDNKTNNFKSNRTGDTDQLVAIDDTADRQQHTQLTSDENVAVRKDALRISSQVSTTIVNTNRGIVSGLYLLDGQPTSDGKQVRVTMRWDKKNDNIRLQLRGHMQR